MTADTTADPSLAYANLEVWLHRRQGRGYPVTVSLRRPDSEAEDRFDAERSIQFQTQVLDRLGDDPEPYGQLLTKRLFADPGVRDMFTVARALPFPLRLRLYVDSSATELHALHWETLRDPADDAPLLSGDRLLFSRFLSSHDWRPIEPQSKRDLTALIAVANPTKQVGPNPGQWPLAPIDVAAEQSRIVAALSEEIPTNIVSSPVTLETLVNHLRKQQPDIFYLVCHGAHVKDEPILYLEGESGEVAPVPASALGKQLKGLVERPRLVVLCSCQSAGGTSRDGIDGSLAALGPYLAEAGVPAVVAMQGAITMDTTKRFMPVFFAELREHGQIDQAMARARNAVRERRDSWMPVLFLRFSTGRFWYVPQVFVVEDMDTPKPRMAGNIDVDDGTAKDFERWPAILTNIARGECTPILGAGLTNAIFGTRRDIAECLADSYHYPLASDERQDLTSVAQYIAVHERQRETLTTELLESYRKELVRRWATVAPGIADQPLRDALREIGRQQRQANPDDPHLVLARLPLSIYVTTNWDELLVDALTEVGKNPQVELFPWNDRVDWPTLMRDEAPGYYPSTESPLVYYLMGRLDYPATLVLTEDDYVDCLFHFVKWRDLVPSAVHKALVSSALLWEGFEIGDRDFRMLFRCITGPDGSQLLAMKYSHVFVQSPSETGVFEDPQRAKAYLTDYFARSNVVMYWGSVDDFARNLGLQLGSRP